MSQPIIPGIPQNETQSVEDAPAEDAVDNDTDTVSSTDELVEFLSDFLSFIHGATFDRWKQEWLEKRKTEQ